MIRIASAQCLRIPVIAVFLTLLTATACLGQTLQTVRLDLVKFIGEAPSFIALHNGYFEEEGLKVSVKYNTAGKSSLKDLFEGKADIITIADTPLVYQGFNRSDFYIIAGMTHSDQIAGAVARKDGGVRTPKDIKGKNVGLFKGTASDYLLDQYLLAQGLSYSDIQTVSLKPKALVKAITAGNIDVIFSWQPHILNTMEALGENAYRLPTKGLKVMDWVAVTKKEYAEKNPEQLEKYLRAISKATRFITDYPRQAIAIFSERSGISQNIITALWEQFSYGLYLNESMLLNMEDQARWHIRKNAITGTKIPNYLNLFHLQALRKVKPEAVTLIK